MNYTKIPNCLLDFHNDIDPAPFRVLCCIYRDTQGFHRATYKIKISKLIEMSGVKGISRCFKILKEKGFIKYEYVSGTSNVITIKPIKSVNGLRNKAIKSVNDTDELNVLNRLNELNASRGAKEKIKENLKKDLFLEFKKKYPEDKFDDDTSFDAWQSLTDADKRLVVGVMEYQNNGWADIDRKYIPKASNYLLKHKLMDESVRKVREDYQAEIRRGKEDVERRRYIQENEDNAASQDEIKEILSQTFPIDKQRQSNGNT